jgi:hypothetical protein
MLAGAIKKKKKATKIEEESDRWVLTI